jgi:hydrogenase expression/formation protein HypD
MGSDPARDQGLTGALLERVRAYAGPPVTAMEVCGTHTVAVARMGLRGLLPHGVRLLSGPGCPVCVTPVGAFDEVIHLALEQGVTVASFGDALRVPGSESSLGEAKARGGDVRVVYSVTDALELAAAEPRRQVVFFGLGFETTSPTVAWAVKSARQRGLENFSVLSAHKALLPAMVALLRDSEVEVGAFLCPGHASMVLGANVYRGLAEEFSVPCVIAGFEPNDVLLGVLGVLEQVGGGVARVQNAYPRAVAPEGNPAALDLLAEVFEPVDSHWRGLGSLPLSGYELVPEYAAFDARRRYLGGRRWAGLEPGGCRCADVLRGVLAPNQCPLFAERCTPNSPVGACMVSSEGACGAHYRYREV